MPKTSKTTRAAKPARKKATRAAKPPRKVSSRHSAKKAMSTATRQVKRTAMQVLAGAAAGAVRAIIPPLEKAAGRSAEAAGIKETPEGTKRAKTKR